MTKVNKEGEEIVEEEETEETEEETEETDESNDTESEEAEDSKESKESKENIEKELDDEIEKEKNFGKPDPNKAKDAFKERKQKRDVDADEDDKPLTRKDLQSVRDSIRQEVLEENAMEIAKRITGSDKEAQLVVLKWKNRSFPEGLSITEQIEEAYVITHRKKLIGERNEALRGLKGKDIANRNAAGTHRDAIKGNAPKMAAQDQEAIVASGFTYNGTSRRYEKKMQNGKTLILDPKTRATYLV